MHFTLTPNVKKKKNCMTLNDCVVYWMRPPFPVGTELFWNLNTWHSVLSIDFHWIVLLIDNYKCRRLTNDKAEDVALHIVQFLYFRLWTDSTYSWYINILETDLVKLLGEMFYLFFIYFSLMFLVRSALISLD